MKIIALLLLLLFSSYNQSQKSGKMDQLSTQNLDLIPIPIELKRICKSIAALEAIISPEWEYRYYSYQKKWSENEEFCEMRNGQGDHMLILFKSGNVVINGFAHESQMIGQEEILSTLPKIFNDFIFEEPVKSIGTSFCIWQTESDNEWKVGNIQFSKDKYKDGSRDLLQLLDGKPLTYKQWAEEYYEEEFEENDLDLRLVEKIYDGTIITKEIVTQINPTMEDFKQLKSDLNEIGYKNEL